MVDEEKRTSLSVGNADRWEISANVQFFIFAERSSTASIMASTETWRLLSIYSSNSLSVVIFKCQWSAKSSEKAWTNYFGTKASRSISICIRRRTVLVSSAARAWWAKAIPIFSLLLVDKKLLKIRRLPWLALSYAKSFWLILDAIKLTIKGIPFTQRLLIHIILNSWLNNCLFKLTHYVS